MTALNLRAVSVTSGKRQKRQESLDFQKFKDLEKNSSDILTTVSQTI